MWQANFMTFPWEVFSEPQGKKLAVLPSCSYSSQSFVPSKWYCNGLFSCLPYYTVQSLRAEALNLQELVQRGYSVSIC